MELRLGLQRAWCLLLVAAAAKAVLVALRASDGTAGGLASPWALPAMLYQDVAACGLIGGLDLLLARAGARRAGWALYAGAAALIAGNVPIARQFGTPLTWAFVAATGGALWDSIAAYATPGNALAALLVAGWALAAPRVVRRAPPAWALAPLLLVLALGPAGLRRCETLGLHRNALAALATTGWARMSAGPAPTGPRAAVAAEGPALDLSHLAGAARGRDVLWVLLESTAARELAIYGAAADPTPRLTALARTAVIFEWAYTSYPESIKSLRALLCGEAPAPDTGAERYDAAVLPCAALPALLGAQGYRTGLFHSGRVAYLGMRHLVEGRGFEALHDAASIGGRFASSFGTDDASTAARLLAWIDEDPGRPYFALYMPIAGHHPYKSPGEGTRPFRGEDEHTHYLNDLHQGDEALGALLDGLAARGRLGRALIVVQGDHGEAFHQHPGNFAHSLFVYEENVRVPLVVALPGALAAPQRAPQVAGAIDVAPTLLALLGLAAPTSWEGRSLLAPEPGVARFFSDYSGVKLGLRTGRRKCVVEPEAARVRVFDLGQDPDEVAAVADEAWAAACAADLEAWAAAQRAEVLAPR